MKRGRAIRPDEIVVEDREIPAFVFDVFNQMLEQKFEPNKSITLLTKDVRTAIKDHLSTLGPEAPTFQDWWLDVENVYRASGWDVSYDRAAYCEDYDDFYTFSVKKDKKHKSGCPDCGKSVVNYANGIGPFPGPIRLCLDSKCGWNSKGIKY